MNYYRRRRREQVTAAWVGEWPLSPPWGGGVSGAGCGRAGDWQGLATVSGTRRRVARVARGIWLSHGREMRTEQRGRRWGRSGGAEKLWGGDGGELLQGAEGSLLLGVWLLCPSGARRTQAGTTSSGLSPGYSNHFGCFDDKWYVFSDSIC